MVHTSRFCTRGARRRLALAALFLNIQALGYASALRVSIPSSPPSNAQPLSPTLLSFSIEADRWPEWAGITERNEFTYNALHNYAALTGKPPSIRVGGDSADRTTWSPGVPLYEDTFPPFTALTPYPEATSVVVGDAYYALSRFLPRGTDMIWGINLGADNVTNAANIAGAIVRAFGSSAVRASGVVLRRLEVGNEPDIYNFTGLRTGDWTPEAYIEQWTANAGAVARVADIQGRNGSVTLQGASFGTQQFTPREVFNSGLLDSAPGRAISVISQHRYSVISSCNGTAVSLEDFMSKDAVRSNLTIFEDDIAAAKAEGLGYILGETNSAACHGSPAVSNTAGAALWAIDYVLQAATLGIQETYFHEGVGYTYNFFQPTFLNRSTTDGTPIDPPQPPHIQPLYYAGLVVNTLIGSSGVAKLVELSVDADNISGYAVFDNGRLVRAAFVNLQGWLSGSTGTRPSVHLDLDYFGEGMNEGKAVIVQRLQMQHADDLGGLTWAGRCFETSDALPIGEVIQERMAVSKGVDLLASDAIVVSFE
ncbi:glycoside hydrolase family 79 protein [Cubamyces sp. BRFM 1775]|nr:glycoside hydrolase family 79 protein [Cubamyces sp. BRFM 1775]